MGTVSLMVCITPALGGQGGGTQQAQQVQGQPRLSIKTLSQKKEARMGKTTDLRTHS